ncbi:MAG: manganese efflux pump MntP family protein [Dehalococcoidales bacterium]|nr:manganese efflux pump MntP family protein [Dehalococcoidales bacterium]
MDTIDQMDSLDLISIFIIAIGLSADCFAVAFSGCIAMKSVSRKQVIIASLSFGIFQALMPLLGWLAGQTVVDLIADYDHWLAFGLLAFIGGQMVWESFRKEDKECTTDITKLSTLLTLSIATSIDALAVGLTFAFLEVNIAVASGVIGVTAFLISILGFLLGRKAGKVLGKRAELIGGLVLIAIGLRILISHLL